MGLFKINWLRLLLLSCLLVLLLDITSVESRAHRLRLKRATENNDELDDQDDDYNADEGHDEFLNDDNDDNDYDGEDDEEDLDNSESEGGTATIVSKPEVFRVPPGSTVFLPCDIINPGSAVIFWKKKNHTIFQAAFKLTTDRRINKLKNSTLVIENVNESDVGEYSCETSTNVKIVHSLLLQTPARIVGLRPQDRERVILQNTVLQLECIAEGDPEPRITWSKEGVLITGNEAVINKGKLTISKAKKSDAGTYQCLAANGIGKPDHRAVNIKILYPPIVKMLKSVISTDVGSRVEIKCEVSSEPRSNIEWHKDNQGISNGEHIHIHYKMNHSTLVIPHMGENDFGKYQCSAKNEIGKDSDSAHVVGEPAKARLHSGSQEPSDSSPVLQWIVESSRPLTEVELKYVKVDESRNYDAEDLQNSDWILVKPDVIERVHPDKNEYNIKHTLRDLRPGKYAATLRARSEYGWNQFSDITFFDGDYEKNLINAAGIFVEAPVAEVGASSSAMKIYEKSTALILSTLLICIARFI